MAHTSIKRSGRLRLGSPLSGCFELRVACLLGPDRLWRSSAACETPVEREHFERWLALFTVAANGHLPPDLAAKALAEASQMAQSFKIGIFPLQGRARRPAWTAPGHVYIRCRGIVLPQILTPHVMHMQTYCELADFEADGPVCGAEPIDSAASKNRRQRMRFMPCFLMTLGLMFALPAAGQAPEIKVVAAGSLTGAFNAMITDYGKTHPVHITTKWGPSGTLRDSLEHGEAFDIFASAALQHAQALTDKEISGPSVLFARNSLCAVVPATSTVTPDTLVDFLLKPETRLATSTPKADPAGDYTWQLFELIDHGRPGAYAALTGKAQQMAGGRLGSALNEGLADVVIAYCSSGRQAAAGGTSRMVPLPSDLAVGAEYGLTLSKHASPEASGFVMYMLSPKAQKMLKDFGFGPVTLPAGDL